MDVLTYLVIIYCCGLVTGYALHLYFQADDAQDDASLSPAKGYAVLVTAEGETISRRRLHQPLKDISKYHGRGPIETFVYTGQNEAGDAVFQVKS
jgi:hypothetical protein